MLPQRYGKLFIHNVQCLVSDAILKMRDDVIDIEEEPTLQMDPITNKKLPLTSCDEYKWKKTYT